MNEDTRGTTQHMMMSEANHDRVHKSTSSCMATLHSRTSNHGFTMIKKVREKPDLFINLYKL
jgi:hypothetical protein